MGTISRVWQSRQEGRVIRDLLLYGALALFTGFVGYPPTSKPVPYWQLSAHSGPPPATTSTNGGPQK